MKRKLTLTNTLKTNAEINVSKKVWNAFCDKLRGELTGIYGKADDELRAVLDDAKTHKPEDWKPTTKKEFIVFLEACAEIYADRTR